MKQKLKQLKIIFLLLATANAFAANYSDGLLTGRFSSWGINPNYNKGSIQLKGLWSKFEKKKEIVVAVIDTGVQYNHPFLKDNIFTSQGKKASTADYGVDFSGAKKSLTPDDNHGHGTHVAGIVKSVFPEVRILALKYYNPKASGLVNLNSTIKALEFAVNANVDVINYSGGGPEPSADELAILKRAEKKGILIIAAAGNEKSNIDERSKAFYPASYGLSNVITVGAHNEENQLISSSNWGEKSVDIAAPGFKIRSSIPGNGAGYMTGTSQATAFVTGVVALLKSQFPNLAYKDIKNIIISSSIKVDALKGKVLGAGKLSAINAFIVAQKVENSTTRKVANHP